ncbi:MAG: signal peptide peptidase SppA [Kiritimatiellae bacterium]|nr:signal peptide peptidase SppA [Kiritimatiellia bacterium]
MSMNEPVFPAPSGPPPRPGAAPQARKGRGGCFWFLLFSFVLTLCVVGGVVLLVVLGVMSNREGLGDVAVDEEPRLDAVWSWGAGDTKVARIPLRGAIIRGEQGFAFASLDVVELALQRIRKATADKDVKAIILEVDSPGGGITASDVLHKALVDFKNSAEGRKVVALLEDVAASGGYYVAVAADYIVAHPTTLTGSIGVLISSLNFKELGEKLGVKDVTVKSGKNKDLLNPLQELTEEQRALLQGVIDDMHARFVRLVAENRKALTEEDVRRLADGQVFLATKALEQGLIDEVGYWEDAVRKTSELLGVDGVKVIKYEEQFGFGSLFRMRARLGLPSRSLLVAPRTRVMYLWNG